MGLFEEYVYSKKSFDRRMAADFGEGLDILLHDESELVRKTAKRMLSGRR